MKVFRRLLGACIALAVSVTAQAQTPKLKLGYLPLNNHTAFYAAEKDLFKKHGVDVDLSLFQSGPLMTQALLSGDLVAGDVATTVMVNMAAQGLPFYFLASDGYQSPKYPAGAIMVRNDDTSIKSFRDLKGKVVGQVAIGTLTYMRLFSAAAKNDLQRNDFREVNVPFGQMGTLLYSKQVDAVYTWPPFDTFISKAGHGRILVDDTDWAPVAAASGLVVRRDWADKNPEAARSLVLAWIEAGRWANDNNEAARSVAAKYLKLPADVAKDMRMLYWPRNGYQLIPSIWDTYYLMVNTGQIKPVADPKKMIDDYWIKPAQRWITPALATLGSQPDPFTAEMLKSPFPNLKGDRAQFSAPWE